MRKYDIKIVNGLGDIIINNIYEVIFDGTECTAKKYRQRKLFVI